MQRFFSAKMHCSLTLLATCVRTLSVYMYCGWRLEGFFNLILYTKLDWHRLRDNILISNTAVSSARDTD